MHEGILTSTGALVLDLVVAAEHRGVVGVVARETVLHRARGGLSTAEELNVRHRHTLNIRDSSACIQRYVSIIYYTFS